MKKIKKTNSDSLPSAWVVSSKDKGRKSIKNGKVYLYDKETFEIELFNPLKKSVLAKIKLNGSYISTSGLVLNPGERIYLDCYIDDRRKFIFSTYSVDGSNEQVLDAIENNGVLEVFFYKESTIDWMTTTTYPITTYPTTPYWYYNYTGSPTIYTNSTLTTTSTNANTLLNSNSSLTSGTILTSAMNSTNTKSINTIETGKVVKGEKSKQNFEYVNMDFDSFCLNSVTIQLLPESRKPIYSSDLKKMKKEGNNDIISLIEKLAELYQKGVLSEKEFSDKKSDLLAKI
jgi:hypothetical protein